MEKLPLDIQIQFFQVYSSDIQISDFEEWLYSHTELEHLLGEETYVDLISLNFKDRHVIQEMKKIIDPWLDFGKFEEWQLRNILADLINRTDSFRGSLIETYYLYCSGYSFLIGLP